MNRRQLFKGIFSKESIKTVVGLSKMSLEGMLGSLDADYGVKESPCEEAGLALRRRRRERLPKAGGTPVKEGSKAITSEKSLEKPPEEEGDASNCQTNIKRKEDD